MNKDPQRKYNKFYAKLPRDPSVHPYWPLGNPNLGFSSYREIKGNDKKTETTTLFRIEGYNYNPENNTYSS